MEAVVDANIIISALIASEGKTKELLFSEELKLITPDFLIGEISKYQREICQKAGFTEPQFNLAKNIIFSKISFYSIKSLNEHFKKAKALCPDRKDAIYFALALKHKCILWSNDKALKKQAAVTVLSTTDLIHAMGIVK
jgi:predicted nucleic acid-binding protein